MTYLNEHINSIKMSNDKNTNQVVIRYSINKKKLDSY